ncbi:hypothetical protein SUBVAR_06459 [Subdoligranulum variabile DSM 15176]|uniref:Uncharacterized protein n=1 Tax=Subdoligranulum variabile DSM 15176 TaxID=411471 RepID=D1PPZ1_9FIRM|nr:hypothetical protein SUBVAR_06459 [Subdoligranulum variabile DSM 15176]
MDVYSPRVWMSWMKGGLFPIVAKKGDGRKQGFPAENRRMAGQTGTSPILACIFPPGGL